MFILRALCVSLIWHVWLHNFHRYNAWTKWLLHQCNTFRWEWGHRSPHWEKYRYICYSLRSYLECEVNKYTDPSQIIYYISSIPTKSPWLMLKNKNFYIRICVKELLIFLCSVILFHEFTAKAVSKIKWKISFSIQLLMPELLCKPLTLNDFGYVDAR